jgi:hypothetical protein
VDRYQEGRPGGADPAAAVAAAGLRDFGRLRRLGRLRLRVGQTRQGPAAAAGLRGQVR